MPKIIWEGNQVLEVNYANEPMPLNAVKISRPDNIFKGSVKYGAIAILFCYLMILFKIELNGFLPMDRKYAIVGLLLGFLLIPVHELLHAICYNREATVYVGISLKSFAAYMVSYFPLTKKKFIFMSLLPTILGLIPLLFFLVIPSEWTILETICLPMGIIGMITPSPDYKDVVLVLKQVPNKALIQASNEGFFWYKP